MNGPGNNYSRLNRKRGRNRTNSIMNILIAIVVVLIIVVASTIFLGGNGKDKADENVLPATGDTNDDDASKDDPVESDDESAVNEGEDVNEDANDDPNEDATTEDETEPEDVTEADLESGVVTYESSNDEVVSETIINTGWQPIGTKQTGVHASSYTKDTVDWNEKVDALAYASGLSTGEMIIWKLKNGGSPQQSVGIISTKDKVDKYRVYLEWVDEKGWKPAKMDILTTLDFDY